ncbi:TVP38/TMEM64 family protein [Streptococcus thermophilus]|uniref:TVP38/TMEM64 family protein n=2 Tax=Streptococcus thermophilus TaxID=1308 RepID=UPI000ABF67CA|nr:VTT domain-containing protein [Streptococcus thermophilus]
MVFKQANFLNALVLISLMILSLAIFGVSSSIFCIFVGLLYAPLLSIPLNIIGNTFDNLTRFEILRRLDKSKRMEKLLNYDEYFKHRFIGIFLAFSIPFIPAALVNYAYVQMKLPTRTRILAPLIGMTPLSVIYVVSGDLLFNCRLIRLPLVGNTCSLAVYLTSNLLYLF